MTTWTLDQIRHVSALRQTIEVDEPNLQPAVLDIIGGRLARALIKAAHPVAVEIHLDDIQIHTEPGHQPWLTRVTAAWQPRTRRVELSGGSKDGALVEVREVGEHIPLFIPIDNPAWDDNPHPTALGPEPWQYRLAGWRETERRWVYALHTPAPRNTHHGQT